MRTLIALALLAGTARAQTTEHGTTTAPIAAKSDKPGEGPARSDADGGAKVDKPGEGPARSDADGGAMVDVDDGQPKLSLPTEADRAAWQRSGFRLGLGL